MVVLAAPGYAKLARSSSSRSFFACTQQNFQSARKQITFLPSTMPIVPFWQSSDLSNTNTHKTILLYYN
jgi:hypothetical protein